MFVSVVPATRQHKVLLGRLFHSLCWVTDSLFTVCDPMALLPCITHLLAVIAAHLHHLCKCSPRLDLRWESPLPSLCFASGYAIVTGVSAQEVLTDPRNPLHCSSRKPDRNQEVCRQGLVKWSLKPQDLAVTWTVLCKFQTCSCFCLTSAPRILERHDSHSHGMPPPLLKLHPYHWDHQTDNWLGIMTSCLDWNRMTGWVDLSWLD